MLLNRREFLFASASSAMLLSMFGPSALADMSSNRWIVLGSEKDFVRLDLITGKTVVIPTPTKAHSFTSLPGDDGLVLGVEKWGRNLSIVDFKKSKIVKSIEPATDREFYGHICLSRDGKHLISPQADGYTGQGYIVWYDRETLKVTDEVPFKIGGSHDLAFLPGTDILAITTSGLLLDYKHPERGPEKRVGPSTVVFFDTKKKSIVHEWDLHQPGNFPGHLKVSTDGRVYFITSVFGKELPEGHQPGRGAVYDATLDQPIREWQIPAEVAASLKSELLSIEINEKLDRLTVTNPTSHQLLTFELKSRKFLSATPTGTTGIVWDREKSMLYGFEPIKGSTTREVLSGFSFQHIPALKMSSHALFIGPGEKS